MSLVVGDIGTVIEFDLKDVDQDGVVQGETNFDTGTSTVNFVFVFSDGTKVTQAGTWISGSKVRYTTQAGDIAVAGRCEIQLQITSTSWTGSTDAPFIVMVGEKL